MIVERKRRAKKSKGGRSMGQRKWPATPLPERGKGKMQAA
jgi:hypothetical protein